MKSTQFGAFSLREMPNLCISNKTVITAEMGVVNDKN
jgi:hypothetical protein